MESAIVTGANGFIGNAVCKELLEKNVTVYAIVRNQSSMSKFYNYPNLYVLEAELPSYKNLCLNIPNDIDVFYHFAWDGTSGKALCDYNRQIKNIQYTCDTLLLAKALRCKKFIMAGTINELELFQFFHAEVNQPRAACIYGISKLTSDLMCKTLAAELNIHYNTAIIGSCYGPGDTSQRIHNVFIKHMLMGTNPKLVQADNMHDWVYIDEVAQMLYAIGEKSLDMKNYYIGHNTLRKLRDILSDVRNILNPGKELVFGEIEPPFFIDYSLIDINSVYQDTDYIGKTDFKQSIMQTANWVNNYFIKSI